MPRRLLLVALVVYVLALAWITLDPFPADPHDNGLLRQLLSAFALSPVLSWLTFDTVEFLANVLLFVPLGALLTVRFGRRMWWLTLALGLATTLTIEFTQLFLPERVSDARDLLANTLGTVVGIALVAAVRRAGR